MNIKLACGSENREVSWSGQGPPTVEQLLNSLKNSHPRRVAAWCDDRGRLRESLPVFVNGEHVRYRQGLQTILKDGDEVYIIPLIAGG
jgi:molybdopterin converting factor small subunit